MSEGKFAKCTDFAGYAVDLINPPSPQGIINNQKGVSSIIEVMSPFIEGMSPIIKGMSPILEGMSPIIKGVSLIMKGVSSIIKGESMIGGILKYRFVAVSTFPGAFKDYSN